VRQTHPHGILGVLGGVRDAVAQAVHLAAGLVAQPLRLIAHAVEEPAAKTSFTHEQHEIEAVGCYFQPPKPTSFTYHLEARAT